MINTKQILYLNDILTDKINISDKHTINSDTTIVLDSLALNVSSAIEWTIMCENATSGYVLLKVIACHNYIDSAKFNVSIILSDNTAQDDIIINVNINTTFIELEITNTSLIFDYDIRIRRNLI